MELKGVLMFPRINALERWPERIRESQSRTHITLNGLRFARLRHGTETGAAGTRGLDCPECAVSEGDYHVTGCDREECPSCHGQLVACACEIHE